MLARHLGLGRDSRETAVSGLGCRALQCVGDRLPKVLEVVKPKYEALFGPVAQTHLRDRLNDVVRNRHDPPPSCLQ